jgi:hypothetical protein
MESDLPSCLLYCQPPVLAGLYMSEHRARFDWSMDLSAILRQSTRMILRSIQCV